MIDSLDLWFFSIKEKRTSHSSGELIKRFMPPAKTNLASATLIYITSSPLFWRGVGGEAIQLYTPIILNSSFINANIIE